MQPNNLDRWRFYIQLVKWQFAKTMPENPHEYTVAKWKPELIKEFQDFVLFIRRYGYQEKYGGRTYTYLNLDGWRYWTMGAPLEQTILINRARFEPNPQAQPEEPENA